MSALGPFWAAWPTTPSSLYAGAAMACQMGPCGKVTSFTNAQGMKLACYFWPAAARAKAVVQLLHGDAGYAMRFLHSQSPGQALEYGGSWVEHLNNAGISVAAHDMQSCGFSEGVGGRRSFFTAFEDLVSDALQFRRVDQMCNCRLILQSGVSGFAADLPVFVSGMSLGGCIALHALLSSASLYSGAALICPMISLERALQAGPNPHLLPLLRAISRVLPFAPLLPQLPTKQYAHLLEEFRADPLAYHGALRARVLSEYIEASRRVRPQLANITVPWICFHGEVDTVCDPAGPKQMLEDSQATDKQLVMLPDRWHILIMEPGREKLIQQMAEWVSSRA